VAGVAMCKSAALPTCREGLVMLGLERSRPFVVWQLQVTDGRYSILRSYSISQSEIPYYHFFVNQ
jgi:hypothetical protein